MESQLSVEKQSKITIIPNLENKFIKENRESFLEYISDKTVLCIENTDFLTAQLDKLFGKAIETFEKLSKDVKHASPEHLFLNQEGFLRKALIFP